MKWKMPCLPGFFPVVNEVQAGGVIGGRTDSNFPEVPSLITRARLGMRPSATHGFARSQVAASNPTIITFGVFIAKVVFSPANCCRRDAKSAPAESGPPLL